MRLPRDLTGAELIRRLAKLGYKTMRQSGSHVRLSTEIPSPHHITVPLHDPLRIGTLGAILADVAQHRRISRDELYDSLFG
jgi:predicted RNA binding protein YcfA (HicA-like mRNA interferase family)